MVHHLLLLLLLLLNRAGRRLLLLLLLARLPLRLVATLAAGVPKTPAVGLILPLATETAKWRLPFKKDNRPFLRRYTFRVTYVKVRDDGLDAGRFKRIVMLITSLLYIVFKSCYANYTVIKCNL